MCAMLQFWFVLGALSGDFPLRRAAGFSQRAVMKQLYATCSTPDSSDFMLNKVEHKNQLLHQSTEV